MTSNDRVLQAEALVAVSKGYPILDAPKADLLVKDEGTVVLFYPQTGSADSWLRDSCETESWQWFGNALAVEPRMVEAIVSGAINEGFTVEAA